MRRPEADAHCGGGARVGLEAGQLRVRPDIYIYIYIYIRSRARASKRVREGGGVGQPGRDMGGLLAV